MGVFICDVHGTQGCYEVCEHIDAALGAGKMLRSKLILEVKVCETCEVRHDLNRFMNEEFPDWSDEAVNQYSLLNATSTCHCLQCIAAVELSSARENGEPDPFSPYERTLTYLQLEIVERLEKALLGNFEFRQSVVELSRKALWVDYGAITCPLTITIYYVTERDHQDAILHWLDQFFAHLTHRQRRVLFYRAENWQSGKRPGVHNRGPEELLRQHDSDPPLVRG
jgi:hypothetical protein